MVHVDRRAEEKGGKKINLPDDASAAGLMVALSTTPLDCAEYISAAATMLTRETNGSAKRRVLI